MRAAAGKGALTERQIRTFLRLAAWGSVVLRWRSPFELEVAKVSPAEVMGTTSLSETTDASAKGTGVVSTSSTAGRQAAPAGNGVDRAGNQLDQPGQAR